MALLDENGDVVEQYQWEPYGSLATLDVAASPRPDNSVGHQGLFFCRFNPQTGDTATLSTTAVGLYHNRNRWYSPSLGRFTSRDPNESALLILATLAINGQAANPVANLFNPKGHYGDGMNLYGYVMGNPISGRDPLGTYSYLETMGTQGIMGIMFGMIGGALGNPNDRLGGALRGGIAGGLAGFAGGAAFGLSGTGLFATLAGTGALEGAIDAGTLSLMENGVSSDVIADMAFGAAIGAATGGLLDAAGPAVRRALRRMPGCFVAGTLVWMADGSTLPIETVREGDLVMAYNEQLGVPEPAVVVSAFTRVSNEVLDLVIAGETIRATAEHPFFVVGKGWQMAASLETGDEILALTGECRRVEECGCERSMEPVYNIEVAGAHNYYVGGHGLLVHNANCRINLHAIADWAAKGPHVDVNGVELRLLSDLTWEPVGKAGGKPLEQALAAAEVWLQDPAARQQIIDKARQILANPPMNQTARNLAHLQATLDALLRWGT